MSHGMRLYTEIDMIILGIHLDSKHHLVVHYAHSPMKSYRLICLAEMGRTDMIKRQREEP